MASSLGFKIILFLHKIYLIQIHIINLTHYQIGMLTKIGLAYFNESMDSLQKHIRSQLAQQNWRVSAHSSQGMIKTQIFSKMKCSDVIHVNSRNDNNPTILKAIAGIQFSQLKYLSADSNNIASFQAFALLNCPMMQQIGLDCNHLTNIRSLRKVNLPVLEFFDIHKNQILEVNGLREWKAPLLQTLALQFDYSPGGIVIQSALTTAIALQSKAIKSIPINKKIRIHSNKVWKMLRNKYEDVKQFF